MVGVVKRALQLCNDGNVFDSFQALATNDVLFCVFF